MLLSVTYFFENKCHLLLVKVSFRVFETEMQTLTLGLAHVVSSPWKHLASTIESSFHLFIIWCISVDTLRSMLDILRSLSNTVIQIKNQRTWARNQGSPTLRTLQPLCSSYVILDQSLMSILYVMKHSKTTTTSRKTGIALTPTHSSSCPWNTTPIMSPTSAMVEDVILTMAANKKTVRKETPN